TYVWDPEYSHWTILPGPDGMPLQILLGANLRFGALQTNGYASLAHSYRQTRGKGGERFHEGLFHFDGAKWIADEKIGVGKPTETEPLYRLLDLDGDGTCEKISPDGAVYAFKSGGDWQRLPFSTPSYAGRYVDLNGDGKLDLVYADEKEFGVYLFADMKT